ncbi:unnamed protein product [Penicillium bialowiezense]
MDVSDTPHKDSGMHTIHDETKDQPRLLLKASNSQLEYVQTLEERLAELERKFEELSRKNPETPSEAGFNDSPGDFYRANDDRYTETDQETEDGERGEEPTQTIIPKARKLNHHNFLNRFSFQTEIPVVEALMINTTFKAAEDANVWSLRRRVEVPEKTLREMSEKNTYEPDAWMARIRVNSVPLVLEVMKVLEAPEDFSRSVTFMHPFEPLLHSRDKLKARLHEMQEALATQSSETDATGNPETGDISEGQEETKVSEIELSELVSLMEVFVRFLEDEVFSFSSKKDKKVRFEALSSIFKLGDILYVPSAQKNLRSKPDALIKRADQRLWRIYRIHRDWNDDSEDDLEIKAYVIEYDGESYIGFRIPPYDGEQDISSLPVFPLRYIENAEQIEEELRSQGRDFVKYQEGLVTHQGWGADLEENASLHYVTGDIVVDMAEAASAHSNCSQYWDFPKYVPKSRSFRSYPTWDWKIVEGIYKYGQKGPSKEENYWEGEYWRLQKTKYCSEIDPFLSHRLKKEDKPYQLQETDFELLPHRVFGFVLQKRKFMALEIRNLKPIKNTKTSDSTLILDPHHRLMLDGVIGSHFQKKYLREAHGGCNLDQDFIVNKGRGLVVLLYGVPGVGKTSTAEQIAHSWQKPLLPVTCGNLGTESNQVEEKLKYIFRLGRKWDCILLMDEADVFLSERTSTALERNALVSVFLRELEYFDGILFLTTNLPGGIDEAFKSRIHITLYYPHLSEQDTMLIWKVNMDRLEVIEKQRARLNDEPPLSINRKAIRKYARQHFRNNVDGKGRWNGRQIRNAFLIASALAEFEKINPSRRVETKSNPDLYDPSFDINPGHFEVVARASLGFEQYLAEAKGRVASEIMYQRGQRADFISSLSEQTAAHSTSKHYPPTQRNQEPSNAPDPFRSQQGWSEGPPGVHNHSMVEHPNYAFAGSTYGEYQARGAQIYHEQLQTPQRDPRMRSNSSNFGSARPRRDIGQGSPSPFQQDYQTNYPNAKVNMSANSDSDDSSDE